MVEKYEVISREFLLEHNGNLSLIPRSGVKRTVVHGVVKAMPYQQNGLIIYLADRMLTKLDIDSGVSTIIADYVDNFHIQYIAKSHFANYNILYISRGKLFILVNDKNEFVSIELAISGLPMLPTTNNYDLEMYKRSSLKRAT
jgi:hypothetical protein